MIFYILGSKYSPYEHKSLPCHTKQRPEQPLIRTMQWVTKSEMDNECKVQMASIGKKTNSQIMTSGHKKYNEQNSRKINTSYPKANKQLF